MYCSNKNDCRLYFKEDLSLDRISKSTAQYLENTLGAREGNFIISIAGPGGSGKSTFVDALSAQLPDSNILRLDDYRKPRAERTESGLLGSNPAASNINLLTEHITKIRLGKSFNKPIYDSVTGRTENYEEFYPARYTVLDGELAFIKEIIDSSDYLIVLNCGMLMQIKTRFHRDTRQRNYSIAKALKVFINSNLLDYNKYYRPNHIYANLIIKRVSKNYYRTIFNQ